MIRRSPISTRNDTPFPYTHRVRSHRDRLCGLPRDNARCRGCAGRRHEVMAGAVHGARWLRAGACEAERGPSGMKKGRGFPRPFRSDEHTSELQSLIRNSYAVFCLKKKQEINKKAKVIELEKQ